MKTIEYDGYLTEDKLGSILSTIFDKVESQVKFGTYKVDYYLPNENIVVEYKSPSSNGAIGVYIGISRKF